MTHGSLSASRVALAVFLVSTPAHAESSASVVVLRVTDDRCRGAERRIVDELRFKGHRVVEVDAPADAPDAERLIDEHGGQAGVQLSGCCENAEADLWMPGPGPRERRHMWLGSLVLGSSVAALKVAAKLHQGLYEREDASSGDADPPVEETTDAAPPVPEPIVGPERIVGKSSPPDAPTVTNRPEKAWLGVYGVLSGDPGLAKFRLGLKVAGWYRIQRVWTLQGSLQAAASPFNVDVVAGKVWTGLASAQAMIVLAPLAHGRISPRLGLGGGVALMWANGRAPNPMYSRSAHGWAGIVTATAGLVVHIKQHLRAIVAIEFSVVTRSVKIRTAHDAVVQFGSPIAQGVLGFEWGALRRRSRKP